MLCEISLTDSQSLELCPVLWTTYYYEQHIYVRFWTPNWLYLHFLLRLRPAVVTPSGDSQLYRWAAAEWPCPQSHSHQSGLCKHNDSSQVSVNTTTAVRSLSIQRQQSGLCQHNDSSQVSVSTTTAVRFMTMQWLQSDLCEHNDSCQVSVNTMTAVRSLSTQWQ